MPNRHSQPSSASMSESVELTACSTGYARLPVSDTEPASISSTSQWHAGDGGGKTTHRHSSSSSITHDRNVRPERAGEEEEEEEEDKFLLSRSALSSSPLEDVHPWSWIGFISFCGSGLMMAVAFLDPGNLEADIQVGATAGYSLLWWLAICSILLGVVVQCLAGRLGLVTGEDLAQHCGNRYPRGACIMLWLFLEAGIVSADVQETIGSAIALSILTGGYISLWAGCLIISLTAFALLMLDSCGFRQLELGFAAFIAIMAVALGVNFFQAQIPASDLAYGLFVPQMSSRTIPVAVAALGALVMPYNVFFQSSVVNARPRDTESEGKKALLIKYMEVENVIVLTIAFVINVFVVCVFAKGFYSLNPAKVVEVGLESAGDHLAEVYGSHFRTLWAVGLLASGQVSTIGLTYAGQLVMTGLLRLKIQAGWRMVATRTVALIPTVALAIIFEASNTFDQVAQILNVVQSLLVPFAIIPVIHMTASEEVMGARFVNPKWLTYLACWIGVVVTVVNVYLLLDLVHREPPSSRGVAYVLAVFFILLYLAIVAYMAVGPDNMIHMQANMKESVRGGQRWVNQTLRTRLGARRVTVEEKDFIIEST